jgi:hypothetical protein
LPLPVICQPRERRQPLEERLHHGPESGQAKTAQN